MESLLPLSLQRVSCRGFPWGRPKRQSRRPNCSLINTDQPPGKQQIESGSAGINRRSPAGGSFKKKKKKTSFSTINIFLYKVKNSKLHSVVL